MRQQCDARPTALSSYVSTSPMPTACRPGIPVLRDLKVHLRLFLVHLQFALVLLYSVLARNKPGMDPVVSSCCFS